MKKLTPQQRKGGPIFGMMNHPARDLAGQIRLAKKLGFDFIDLTLEPPEAGTEKFLVDKAAELITEAGLGVVGHTGWHLYGNAAYPEVRCGIAESLVWAAAHFGRLGASVMTYHIHGAVAKYTGLKAAIDNQIEVLKIASEGAAKHGVTIMLEHLSGYPEQFEILDEIFENIDSLGFHLDVGHANLSADGNRTSEFLRRYGKRLRHVHLSDNRGRNDDHLPLGVGTVPWPKVMSLLAKYHVTYTLEVFSEDDEYVSVSLRKAREWLLGPGQSTPIAE